MAKEGKSGNLDGPVGYLMRLDRCRFGIAVETVACEVEASDGVVVVVVGPTGSL